MSTYLVTGKVPGIPKLITAMLSGNPPTIYGDGEQSRDFTYIEIAKKFLGYHPKVSFEEGLEKL